MERNFSSPVPTDVLFFFLRLLVGGPRSTQHKVRDAPLAAEPLDYHRVHRGAHVTGSIDPSATPSQDSERGKAVNKVTGDHI